MIDFTMPSLGADMQSGKIVDWLIKPGVVIKKGDIVADVETEKGVIEIESWYSGQVAEICAGVGDVIKVGDVIARIKEEADFAKIDKPSDFPLKQEIFTPDKDDIPQEQRQFSLSDTKIKASPLARKIAAEYSVDLALVDRSDGVVRRGDVERYLRSQDKILLSQDNVSASQDNVSASQDNVSASQDNVSASQDKPPHLQPRVSSGSRRVIAQLMSRSHQEIPHYYLSSSVSVGKCLELMNRLNQSRSPSDQLLPVVFFLKALALTCRHFPDFNGFWIDDGYKAADCIGVGLSIYTHDQGLVAPSLKGIEEKNIFEIMDQVMDLVSRVRGGKIRREEMAESSITCTYLGDRGAREVFGIIYPPQVALLGVGEIFRMPYVEGNAIGIGSFVNISLSGDHRAHDGHRGSLFLRKIKDFIEEPFQEGGLYAQ